MAPCDCKGDTRYLHVQCLQKWYVQLISDTAIIVITAVIHSISLFAVAIFLSPVLPRPSLLHLFVLVPLPPSTQVPLFDMRPHGPCHTHHRQWSPGL